MMEENILSRLKVLKCLFQYPIDCLVPSNDLLRAVCYHPIVPLQIAPWVWRASHINAVNDVALPDPQLLQKPVVERQKIPVSFYFWRLIRNHSSIGPTLVSILCDLSPWTVTTMFDPCPFFANSPHRKNPPEPRALGVHDTERPWLRRPTRSIRPSHKSHAFMRFIRPSMFVCTLARVSECEALTHCMSGMCGCMSYVVFV